MRQSYVEISNINTPEGEEDSNGKEKVCRLLERFRIDQRPLGTLELPWPGQENDEYRVKYNNEAHHPDRPGISDLRRQLLRDLHLSVHYPSMMTGA